ncbi:hypothetical protein M4D48_07220 [Alkalihalobacillus clausii]|jgi:hypothetical protein|nr:hypothetical protein [Shouchella clausii]MCM3548363.1 hypothetical protein [Shouchella clausii]
MEPYNIQKASLYLKWGPLQPGDNDSVFAEIVDGLFCTVKDAHPKGKEYA